jgi:hypothetical protein
MLDTYVNLLIAVVCGTAGWLVGASSEWYKSRQLVKELMASYKDHDELLEAFYEMGKAQEAQQPGHPSLLRNSHLRPVK